MDREDAAAEVMDAGIMRRHSVSNTMRWLAGYGTVQTLQNCWGEKKQPNFTLTLNEESR
jgi:hypothetical protein